MGRDPGSDYISNASDPYYGDTLSPGALDYYRESPGPGESSILSPAETAMSPAYDEPKNRSRASPTARDQSARAVSSKRGPKNLRARSRFEGVASYARDYLPPPTEALLEAFPSFKDASRIPETPVAEPSPKKGGRAVFEGVSGYQRDYPPPPKEALKRSVLAKASSEKQTTGARPPFDAVSMNKRDFPAPPAEVYRQNRDASKMRQKGDDLPPSTGKRPPFEGQSMSKRDYASPPKEAYMREKPQRSSELEDASKPSKSRFDATSAQKRDFVAPPSEAYSKRSGSAPATGDSRSGKPARARFEGESQSRRDFVPPPREAYNAAFATTGESKKPARVVSRFQSKSTSSSHYTAPPKEAYLRDDGENRTPESSQRSSRASQMRL